MSTWTKRSDAILDNEVLHGVSSDAYRVYDLMTAASNRMMSDGRFTALNLSMYCGMLTPSKRKEAITELVSVGLVAKDGQEFVLNRYLDEQVSAARIEEKREANRARQATWADKNAAANALVGALGATLVTPPYTDTETDTYPDAQTETGDPPTGIFNQLFFVEYGQRYSSDVGVTDSERQKVVLAAIELSKLRPAPGSVEAKAARYREKRPDMPLTAKALVSNWKKLDQPTQREKERNLAAEMTAGLVSE